MHSHLVTDGVLDLGASHRTSLRERAAQAWVTGGAFCEGGIAGPVAGDQAPHEARGEPRPGNLVALIFD